MKKIFVMAVMAAATLTANAQWWAGGEVGFTSSHTNGVGTEKNFTIQPEVGYSLNDKFDVALSIGYTYASEKLNKKLGGDKYSANAFEINPYVRYKFVKAGNFFAFVDGGIEYATCHYQGVSNNENQLGISITPGIAYNVSPKVTLVSHLGEGLYYNHEWMKDTYHANNVGFRLFNGITFGAYYNF